MNSNNAIAVEDMFDSIAQRYDLFNHLTSMGMAYFWRKACLTEAKPGVHILDLGCGTGDLTLAAAKKLKGSGQVTGIDISKQMIGYAKKRYEKSPFCGYHNVEFLRYDATQLPLENRSFDLIVSAFVLRNLGPSIDRVLEGVHRSLAPGGRVRFLDFTVPKKRWLATCWKIYMNTVVAFYGVLLFGKKYPAGYMTGSAERFLKADELMQLLERKNFKDVKSKPFLFGIIRLYEASKDVREKTS